jgi:hypothetical protein
VQCPLPGIQHGFADFTYNIKSRFVQTLIDTASPSCHSFLTHSTPL